MKVLFVVPPFAGHVLPTVSVSRALVARGHDVAWVGFDGVGRLLPAEAQLFVIDGSLAGAGTDWARIIERSHLRGLEALVYLYEEVLFPLSRAMLPGISDAIVRYQPDVVVVDHETTAGAFAARRAGVRWATLGTTSVSLTDPFGEFPKAKEWHRQLVVALEAEAGLAPASIPDVSPHCVIVFSTHALAGQRPWPSHYVFVGPAIQERPDATPFPWEDLGGRPRVFVSLGTIDTLTSASTGFYSSVVEALRSFDGQVILVAPPDTVKDAPPTFIVRPRVPQLALLKHVDAVVCHGGHNTVCEALACGLPLVVAPIRHDQPIVANQVVAAGAGVRIRYGRMSPAPLRAAVDQVLREPSFRTAAERVSASFDRAGGATAAAAALEAMV